MRDGAVDHRQAAVGHVEDNTAPVQGDAVPGDRTVDQAHHAVIENPGPVRVGLGQRLAEDGRGRDGGLRAHAVVEPHPQVGEHPAARQRQRTIVVDAGTPGGGGVGRDGGADDIRRAEIGQAAALIVAGGVAAHRDADRPQVRAGRVVDAGAVGGHALGQDAVGDGQATAAVDNSTPLAGRAADHLSAIHAGPAQWADENGAAVTPGAVALKQAVAQAQLTVGVDRPALTDVRAIPPHGRAVIRKRSAGNRQGAEVVNRSAAALGPCPEAAGRLIAREAAAADRQRPGVVDGAAAAGAKVAGPVKVKAGIGDCGRAAAVDRAAVKTTG